MSTKITFRIFSASLFVLFTLFLITSCKELIQDKSDQVCLGIPAPEPKEEKEPNPKIEEIIPPGYTIVNNEKGQELIYGDLNKDGFQDAVLLVEMKGDTSYDLSQEVLLMIYTADSHKQLQLTSASKNLGGEAAMYNRGSGILSVKKQVITYHHQSMRHDMDLKFRYDINSGDFVLIGKDYTGYGGIEDGPSKISINYLTGIKLVNNSKWDDGAEEVIPLPEVRTTFQSPLQSLSSINWETLYDDL